LGDLSALPEIEGSVRDASNSRDGHNDKRSRKVVILNAVLFTNPVRCGVKVGAG